MLLINKNHIKRQSGSILLITILIIMTSSAFLLIKKLNQNIQSQIYIKKNYRILQKAKQALIAYAVANAETQLNRRGKYGFLPCPTLESSSEEGNSIGSCNNLYFNALGRFPWQSLNIEPLKDSSGECLWYAVSGAFKNHPNNMLNFDTTGSFQVKNRKGIIITGGDPTNRVVAVIIAPGHSLNNQERKTVTKAKICKGNYEPSNYLDYDLPLNINNASLTEIADTIDTFMSTDNPLDKNFNDMIVYITSEEIFAAVRKRQDIANKLYEPANEQNLTRMITKCIANFAKDDRFNNQHRIPWAAPLQLSDYRNNSDYNDYSNPNDILFGRVPIIIENSLNALGSGVSNTFNNLEEISTTTNDNNFIDYCADTWERLNYANEDKITELKNLWKNWKDHLFYATAKAYQAASYVHDDCRDSKGCITVNSDYASNPDDYFAGIVIFAGDPIEIQSRLTAPLDIEQKHDINQYIENKPGQTNNTELYSNKMDDYIHRYDYGNFDNFNDVLYCINESFNVSHCPK